MGDCKRAEGGNNPKKTERAGAHLGPGGPIVRGVDLRWVEQPSTWLTLGEGARKVGVPTLTVIKRKCWAKSTRPMKETEGGVPNVGETSCSCVLEQSETNQAPACLLSVG